MKEDMTPLRALIMFLAEVGTIEMPDGCSDTINTRIENLYSDIARCTSEDKEQLRIEIETIIQSPDMTDDVRPFLRELSHYITGE